MAIDPKLNERFRVAVEELSEITEKNMMGGTCFMLNGNMLGGADINKEGEHRFMFRVGKDNEAEALKRAGAIPVELGKRRMGGLVFVDAGLCNKRQLAAWIKLAYSFVGILPAK